MTRSLTPGHQRLGGGSGIPTTDTHVASNIDTRQSTTAGSRGRKSRVLELEQEVSKLLSINEHQQAAMRDLEEVATKQNKCSNHCIIILIAVVMKAILGNHFHLEESATKRWRR